MPNEVYVIAEIGINHEGDVEQCCQMVDAAVASGADAVKLQTIDAEANYVQGTASYDVFKKSELTSKETETIFQYAHEIGIDILTTCGDLPTANWVDKLNPVAWKVSSGLLTHTPMINSLANFGRPMLISTGMATIDEIDQAVNVIEKAGNSDITIFQCTSLYPAPPETLNLSSITFLKEQYNYKIGFSDHSTGDDAVFLSVAAGATVIEKHFTLDSNRTGFDHPISLEPHQFKKMVSRIRLAEKMMGVVDKRVSEAVFGNRKTISRVIVAQRKIKKGEPLTADNIAIKRPIDQQSGIAPINYEKIIGSIALNDIEANSTIIDTDTVLSSNNR